MSSPVLLVTGGAAGIGRGIAQAFVKGGYRVVVADIDGRAARATAESLSDAGEVMATELDVRDEDAVHACMSEVAARFGRLDCLCNNAGIEVYRFAADYTGEEFDRIVSTNLRGTFLMTKYGFPLLKASSGCIVNISSVQGFANETSISVYAATKAALLGYTRATALDFAPHGVRVNAVCPGAIHTAMTGTFLKDRPDPAAELAQMAKNVPLRRLGTPEDVAGVVRFLASAEASYITGTSIVADGGLLARLAI